MKKFIYCVRLVGSPLNRRYILQRSDAKFWGGRGRWTGQQKNALVYRTLADAQAGVRPFIARQTRGQPRRQFTCMLVVNVIGDDINAVTAQDVTDALVKTMVIGIDYEVLHDGLLAKHHVEVRARLGGLAEVPAAGLIEP